MTSADVPAHVRARPPAAALGWAAAAAGEGARLVGIRPLRRSRWHANHVLRFQPGVGPEFRLVLRRWARPGWERDDPDFDARREASILELLAATDVPAPRLVAVDAEGTRADVPALLMTMVEGRPPGRSIGIARVAAEMARALAAIHAVSTAPDSIPAYRPWRSLLSARLPAWMRGGSVWSAVHALATSPPPRGATGFIHRDYHHGNTLWIGSQLSGVVDWTTGSWGPLGVDLGHARWNLAAAYGTPAAQIFLEEYTRLAPQPVGDTAYWDAVQLIDALGDDQVSDPDPATRERLERYARRLIDPAAAMEH